MPTFEILNGAAVVNVIVADQAFVDAHYAGKYRLVVEEAQAATPVVPETRITRLAFLSRFTDAEAVGIDLASIGATVPAASMRRYMTKVNAATFIDLSRADTRSGVIALEGAGLLAAGRALIILDTAPTQEELYRG